MRLADSFWAKLTFLSIGLIIGLFVLAAFASCGHAPDRTAEHDRFDASLMEACEPDPRPSACTDPEAQPEGEGSRTLERATNDLLTGRARVAVWSLSELLERRAAEACVKEHARWRRSSAYHGLKDYRASFLDAAAIVRRGPAAPFYRQAAARIDRLAGKVPAGAIAECRRTIAGYAAD